MLPTPSHDLPLFCFGRRPTLTFPPHLQHYPPLWDHRIVNNHLLLLLLGGGRFKNTIILVADADEFFVPQVVPWVVA